MGGSLEPSREEAIEAVDSAEDKRAARAGEVSAEVELLALKPVTVGVVLEGSGSRIELRQTAVGAQPELSVAVGFDSVDDVVGEPIVGPCTCGIVAVPVVVDRPSRVTRPPPTVPIHSLPEAST